MSTTTFHNDPDLKCALIRRAQMHREADRLRQGFSYMRVVFYDEARHPEDEGEIKGCAIGCLSTPANVSTQQIRETFGTPRPNQQDCQRVLYEDFGLPSLLIFWAERIFEHLPVEDARTWPEEFARAVPVGFKLGRSDQLNAINAELNRMDSKRWTRASWRNMKNSLVSRLESLIPNQEQPSCPPIVSKEEQVPIPA